MNLGVRQWHFLIASIEIVLLVFESPSRPIKAVPYFLLCWIYNHHALLSGYFNLGHLQWSD